ncbi:MAG TPA: fused MFS/spermidine synthase [Polyangiaceae bacterium]
MDLTVRRVAPLLFGSGFAALVYQTSWQRLFQLTFGASTAASAAVLAIFLGGLGLGGVLFGRRIERSEQPLRYYAHLEIGIALWAALTPFLRIGVHRLYLALGGVETLGSSAASAIRLLLAALVIGPAAVLMGGTLPAVARAVVTEADAGRHRLALLYAVNTIGAVAGALVGPLLLFGLIGTQLTLWAAVLSNLLVGVVARAMAREVPRIAAATAAGASAGEPAARHTVVWAYFTAAAAGFGFLALELVWFRVLSPLLGGSSITFGLILATALLGIGVGGLLFALRPREHVTTVELVATTLAAEAFFVLLPFAWGDDIALLTAHLRQTANLGLGYLVATWFAVAGLIVFPASVVSGYQFPALFALLGRGRAGIGRHVGEAYAYNTAGTLLGSLLTGFVLLPQLGAVGTWRLIALSFSVLGLAGAVLAWRTGARASRVAVPSSIAVAALLLASSEGPGAVFRHSPVGAGRVSVASLDANQVVALRRRTEEHTIWQRDGVESSVAINVQNGIAFIVNGKSDGSVVGDRGTQAFLGLLPAALHPHPKRAFVVGLGTGMTAGLLAKAPGMERVVVAELEPSIVEVARRAAPVNGNVLDNRRVQIEIGDGREILLTNRQKYDLVISEPSNPYRAGIASLFTREFYEAGAARLAPGGFYAQWVQAYEIDARTLTTVIRTLSSVFPHVSIWGPGGADLVLIGSMSPQVVDLARLRRVLAEPHYLEWMRRTWNMEGAEALLAHHIAPPPVTASLAGDESGPVNTDDVNVLEFAFGWQVGLGAYSAMEDLLGAIDVESQKPRVSGAIDWALVDDQRHRVEWSTGAGPPPSPRVQATVVGCNGNMRRAGELWPEGVEPGELVEKWVVGWIDAARGRDVALARALELEQAGFRAEALLLRSRAAEKRGDLDGAVGLLLESFEQLRRTALPLCDVATRALKRAKTLARTHPSRAADLLRTVSSGPLAVYVSERFRRNTREQIGIQSTDPALCAEAFARRHGNATYELLPLTMRARCFEKVGSPDLELALSELEAFLEHQPATFRDLAIEAPPAGGSAEKAGN